MVGVLAAGAVYLGLLSRTFAQAAQTNPLVEYVSPSRPSSDATPNSIYADEHRRFRLHHRSVVGGCSQAQHQDFLW